MRPAIFRATLARAGTAGVASARDFAARGPNPRCNAPQGHFCARGYLSFGAWHGTY